MMRRTTMAAAFGLSIVLAVLSRIEAQTPPPQRVVAHWETRQGSGEVELSVVLSGAVSGTFHVGGVTDSCRAPAPVSRRTLGRPPMQVVLACTVGLDGSLFGIVQASPRELQVVTITPYSDRPRRDVLLRIPMPLSGPVEIVVDPAGLLRTF